MLRIVNSCDALRKSTWSVPFKSLVALGAHHSLMLTPDKITGNPILKAIGSNGKLKQIIQEFGQCGFAEFGGTGFLDEEEDETLNEWTRMMNGLDDDFIKEIACGDFHSVAMMRNGSIRTWGSGILGHGNEWYDSRPQTVRFFTYTGRKVEFISAKSSLTGCLAKSNDGFLEAYVWGYLKDQSGNLCKALSPSLVKDALKLNNISNISCGFNGSFSILGEKDGNCVLQIYNATSMGPISIPYAPFCESVHLIDQVYEIKPTMEINVNRNIHSISLGHDAIMYVENNGLKILDFKSGNIYDKGKDGIQNGVFGANNVLLSTSNELYAYGMKDYSNLISRDTTFFQFLKQSFMVKSSEDQSLPFKSTLEILNETPHVFKIGKPASKLWASYREFLFAQEE